MKRFLKEKTKKMEEGQEQEAALYAPREKSSAPPPPAATRLGLKPKNVLQSKKPPKGKKGIL